jgi:Uma2 family endonuclease
MGMPQVPRVWTAAAVRALPADGRRYELVDGELLVTPSPTGVHQRTIMALIRRLDPYLRHSEIGELLISPADLSLSADELLQPDLFVVPPRRAPPRWSEINSLLIAVEVLSPGTARYDRLLKRRRYQRAQVPEYWIVDPDGRLVERWRPEDQRPEILSETLEWKADPAAAPLVIDLAELFAEVWGEGER